MFQVRLAVAGHAGIHGHRGACGGGPDIAGIAADAGFLVGAQGVGRAVIAVALLAFGIALLDVGGVREGDVLGLARVDQPLGLAIGGYVFFNEQLFGGRSAHRRGVTAGAFVELGNAGEAAVGEERVAVVTFG